MADTKKLVLLFGFKKEYKDFNGQLGETTGIATKDGKIKVLFKKGIKVPSFTIGEVIWATVPVANTKVITRKAIISPETQAKKNKKTKVNRKR